MPWHTHDQPIRITNLKARRLPKSYISCTEFGDSQFKAQKPPADWDYHELKTGHDAMITIPNEQRYTRSRKHKICNYKF
jgi:hypothetical protein